MELYSYFCTMMAVMFWIFRLILAIAPSMSLEIPFETTNLEIEIIVLFLSIIGLIGVFKRKTFLTAIYLGVYFAFFGYEVYSITQGKEKIEGKDLINVVLSISGIVIAALNFVDVLINPERKGKKRNTKTDWYYNTDKYERELDERADKNQYKIK